MCLEEKELKFRLSSPSYSQNIHTKSYGDIPTYTQLTGTSNARVYEKIAIVNQYLALSPK